MTSKIVSPVRGFSSILYAKTVVFCVLCLQFCVIVFGRCCDADSKVSPFLDCLLNENTVFVCLQRFLKRNPQLVAMAILFAVVARGTTILAKHAWCGGNFLEVTEQILAKIPSENNKLTYSHGR